MGDSFVSFLTSAVWVTLAEMGDKTQILAMCFASSYGAPRVLLGVLLATLLNNTLAVGLGNILAGLDMLTDWIQLVAALSFVFFGLWTLRGEKNNEDASCDVRKPNPVITVAVAFFIAELGDKTQLATIALSARYAGSALFVLAGSSLGMMIANSIGVIFGSVAGKKISKETIQLLSSVIFILFGLISAYQALAVNFGMQGWALILPLSFLAVFSAAAWILLLRRTRV
ncbi:MAG TPA: UPF0016 domain-containing protein [Clostridiales bacterium]|nr:UPF0016 domain-containing protein [Clostridiales bacterium]